MTAQNHVLRHRRKTQRRLGDSVNVLAYNKQEATFMLGIATDKPSERIIIYRPDHATN